MTAEQTGSDPEKEVPNLAIERAWAAVKAAGVPSQYQETIFLEVLKSILEAKPQRESQLELKESPYDNLGELEESRPSGPSEYDVFQEISMHTGIRPFVLRDVFRVENGVVRLLGSRTLYGSTTTERARNVARIVTVVRKVGMGHAATSFDLLIDACKRMNCYDSQNFATNHMQGIDGFIVKEESDNQWLEARGLGIAAFPILINNILDGARDF